MELGYQGPHTRSALGRHFRAWNLANYRWSTAAWSRDRRLLRDVIIDWVKKKKVLN